jgi:hypothetical protein
MEEHDAFRGSPWNVKPTIMAPTFGAESAKAPLP